MLWTKDEEGNYFALKGNGDIDTKIAVSLNVEVFNNFSSTIILLNKPIHC